ncbi:MAG: D-hexose-6-phosphate mutarotase [Gammaproteobacteria bacterium]|nr:D-hexose-6-phosphate mutarotase [Gammaproteobacteria bacterium]MDH5593362.1 D-hexose-6-phosphate mutarotase [Gammaproteobacteria bacterium]
MTLNIETLNQQFSFQNGAHSLSFKFGKGDIPVIEIKNEQASATISLQGAHVLSWIPHGEEQVIWVSDDAKFAPGKSVRGGIPICWPWFGPHETNSSFQAHGFARTVMWQVVSATPLSTGETRVVFKLETDQLDADSQAMWPSATTAEYYLTIGKTLTLELVTTNNSDQAFTVGQALHTYFKVDNVANTRVIGLEGKEYLDKTDGFKCKTQTGPVTISEEVDRVYVQTPDDVIINDGKRNIVIRKKGSHSTVVWNPWQVVAEKMGDLGKDGYLKMLCVESANAAEDTVTVNAGESCTLLVNYEINSATVS